MSKRELDSPSEIESWTRSYYKIKDESTDAFLVRKGFTADTPDGLVKRLYMGLAWIAPQVTEHTRHLIDEIKAILARYESGRMIIHEPRQQTEQPMLMPQRPTEAKIVLPPPLTPLDLLQLKHGETLFEQARALHRLQPTIDAQAKYRRAQSKKASASGKLTEGQRRMIAKHYWDCKANGTLYGVVKQLARDYDVSRATINAVANRYNPN